MLHTYVSNETNGGLFRGSECPMPIDCVKKGGNQLNQCWSRKARSTELMRINCNGPINSIGKKKMLAKMFKIFAWNSVNSTLEIVFTSIYYLAIFLSKRVKESSLPAQISTNSELVGSELMRLTRVFICFALIILLLGIHPKEIIQKKKNAMGKERIITALVKILKGRQ